MVHKVVDHFRGVGCRFRMMWGNGGVLVSEGLDSKLGDDLVEFGRIMFLSTHLFGW